jgi:hypothetical protein
MKKDASEYLVVRSLETWAILEVVMMRMEIPTTGSVAVEPE